MSARPADPAPALLTVTVDTEEEWDWEAGWPTTRPSVANVQRLPRFQEACERHGIAATYFVNYAVLDDPAAAAVIRALAARPGVEIGIHIHPWNTPPLREGGPVTARETFLHNLEDEVVEAKLASLLARFLENGLRPTSFRGGRYSSDGRIQGFLRDRGLLADSSVVPRTSWPDDGAPDFRARGVQPIRRPPRREGDAPLWEIPLSLGFTRPPFALWRALYGAAERPWLRWLHPVGIVERLGLVERVWLNFELETAPRMLRFAASLLARGVPTVCLTVHSSSLASGPGPYARGPADEARVFQTIEEVFAALAARADLAPVTMTGAAARLEERFHARTGH